MDHNYLVKTTTNGKTTNGTVFDITNVHKNINDEVLQFRDEIFRKLVNFNDDLVETYFPKKSTEKGKDFIVLIYPCYPETHCLRYNLEEFKDFPKAAKSIETEIGKLKNRISKLWVEGLRDVGYSD